MTKSQPFTSQTQKRPHSNERGLSYSPAKAVLCPVLIPAFSLPALLREGWKADLALLPALRVRQGPAPGGGAPAALVEALACGGVREVVISLRGETSPGILERFRSHRAEGKSAAEALKLTRQWARGENPDPAHWAGLVLYSAP